MSDVASLDVTRYARLWRRHWAASWVVAILVLFIVAWPALLVLLFLADHSYGAAGVGRPVGLPILGAGHAALTGPIAYVLPATAVLLIVASLRVAGTFRHRTAEAGLVLLAVLTVLLGAALGAVAESANPIRDAIALADRPREDWHKDGTWIALLLTVLVTLAAGLLVWQSWLLWCLRAHRPGEGWPPTRRMTRSPGANLGFAGAFSWRRLSPAGVAVQAAVAAAVAGALWFYWFEIFHKAGNGLLALGYLLVAGALTLIGVVYNLLRAHWPLVTQEILAQLFAYTPRVLGLMAICAGLLAVAAVWRYGERLNRRRRDRLILAGAKPPVLLLRSFVDDVARIRPNSLLKRLFLRRKRLEECVGEELSRAGPFIAVGKPGETLPPLGAERIYLADDQWQAAVKSFIDRSDPIILIAGLTHWVRWELGSIMEQSRIARLLIVFPPSRGGDRAARWENLKASLAGTPWEAAAARADVTHTLALLLRAGGGLVQVESRRVAESDYEAAFRVATYALSAPREPTSAAP